MVSHMQRSSLSLSLSGSLRSDREKEAISIQRTILHFTKARRRLDRKGGSRNNSLELTIREAQLGIWQKERELGLNQNQGMGPEKLLLCQHRCVMAVGPHCLLTLPVCPDSRSSEKKYCSGTGWPSFSEAHGAKGSDESHAGILRRLDTSLGHARMEVVCKQVMRFAFLPFL